MKAQSGLKVIAVLACALALDQTWAQHADEKPLTGKESPSSAKRVSAEIDLADVGHLEFPDDAYIHVPREGRATSPGGRYVRDGYVSVQVNVNALGQNILGDAANEPSIAVDPTNPNKMAIGWRQFDTVTNNFRQAGWGYTTDGGNSWTFPGVIEPGVFRSDPVLAADADGNFYYNSLTADEFLTDFWCHVYKSTDGGVTWDSGTYAYGGDKQWMVIDQTDGIGRNNIYAFWTYFYSSCSGNFTRSYDEAGSFVDCTSVPTTPQWGTRAVGPDGELYIGGDGFTVAKSSTLQDESLPIQWDFTTTVSLDGSIGYSGGPNPGGLLGQVWIAVDHSDGPTRGNVYLLCSVQRSSTPDPLDVMFARSTNGGTTWSPPMRINDDPPDNGAYQWFGTMSVAPNGRIDVIWNDTRNDPGGHDSELYYSFSEDGGLSWSPNEALSPQYDPHLGYPDQNKMGDYYDMVSDDLGASVAYAATFNGEQDVYYLRIGDTCSEVGTVALDQPKYGCESTAGITVVDCGLNVNESLVDFVTVDVDSDSETGVEQVLLAETDADSARFEGSITLSTIDDSGVLLVAEGDTFTVTYLDADDGQGGTNVNVIKTAPVDCTGPAISNVQTADIGPFDAQVTFDTDEPAAASARYGESCSALNQDAAVNGYRTEHSVRLTGLQENTTYYYAVDAEDEAGNFATDNNGGVCYTFVTVDVPLYFTEQFESTGNDLAYHSMLFAPDGSADYYRGCIESIFELPTNPSGGTTLSPGEDGFVTVTLTGGKTVSLYGVSYSTFYVGSNGYITFTSGDGDYSESLTDHFSLPRISALFDDFSPQEGGPVSWKQLEDRAVVTFENVPEWNAGGSNTFQFEMYFDGTIVLSYLGMSAADGIAGLSAGTGIPPNFYELDLSAMGRCSSDCNENGVPDDEDIALGTSQDCNNNGVPDECDIADGTSEDLNGDGIPDECVLAPGPEPGGPSCNKAADCQGAWAGADCVAGTCYIAKNRYLSIDPTINDEDVAFVVVLTESEPYPSAVGRTWWLAEPLCYDFPDGNVVVPTPATCEGPDRFGWVAHLTDAAVTRAWSESPLHVTGCGIAPVVTYEIRATDDGGGTFSPSLEINTIHRLEGETQSWGDVTGGPVEGMPGLWLAPDRVTNFSDVGNSIRTFENRAEDTGFPPRLWVDVEINQVVNLADIQFLITAFEGSGYTDLNLPLIGIHPADCP